MTLGHRALLCQLLAKGGWELYSVLLPCPPSDVRLTDTLQLAAAACLYEGVGYKQTRLREVKSIALAGKWGVKVKGWK